MEQTLRETFKTEIEGFRELGRRFLQKELTTPEFKAKSGGMGAYAERGGQTFMIRLRMPSGIVTKEHLGLVVRYADEYGLDQVHLTTRQTIQLHHLSIDAVCDIMEDAIDHGLYTRGGGGNYPRNVALSPLSGVMPGEAFDVTPFAVAAGDYLLERMTEYRLPRKLKIAFSNDGSDTANARATDLGFLAVREGGKPRFEVWLAGGLGANPTPGIPLGRTIGPREVFYHIEAVTRLFMAKGDYQNRARARLRYLPERMGTEGFLAAYREYLEKVKAEGGLPEIAVQSGPEDERPAPESDHPRLVPQKQAGLFAVLVHPRGGLLKTGELRMLSEFADSAGGAEIRLTMEEGMYFRGLSEQEARELLSRTADFCADTQAGQSVSCIGVPTCQIGMERSEALLAAILAALDRSGAGAQLLPRIRISGCQNSCSRHQLAPLGFAGKRKRVGEQIVDAYELFAGGGCGSEGVRLAEPLGVIPETEIPHLICEIAGELEREGLPFEEYRKTRAEEWERLLSRYRI